MRASRSSEQPPAPSHRTLASVGTSPVRKAGRIAVALSAMIWPVGGDTMEQHQSGKPRIAPYGTWASPLSAARATAGALGLGQIAVDGNDVYWLEARPGEGGRNVLVRQAPGRSPVDVTRGPFNVRTRVHEYGGAPYSVHRGTVYASNFADQRLYEFAPGAAAPRPITPAGYYYAQCQVDAKRGGSRLVCIREDHTASAQQEQARAQPSPPPSTAAPDKPHQPAAAIVALPTTAAAPAAGHVLVSGADFYSDAMVSPDGRRLAWLQWNHPNMPWDGTELYVATLDDTGVPTAPVRVAGGPDESVFQPRWSPDGRLYFVSDRSGWWNLYRWQEKEDRVEPLLPRAADFGKPQWVFGGTTYGFQSAERMVVTWTEDGRWRLGVLTLDDARRLEPVPLARDPVGALVVDSRAAWFIGASATESTAVLRLPLADLKPEILKRANTDVLDARYVSKAQAITFDSAGLATYAFYYPPTNADFEAPAGTRPPLLVLSHGGPTGATDPNYRADIQFWTTRGFAVVDVNYGGSTGYGRAYRRRLNGQWGIVDVRDAIAAAQHLVAAGKADPQRLVTRGGSAGGYTTLAALTFHDTFKAGASYYGISDLEVLARDTHKFESRYLDSMVGPYPAARALYRERSPIHFVDRLDCALILLQGLQDKVVPPNQSQMMADAVRRKGLPVAYVTFEGEQHGFRKAENLVRALEAELYFYGRVLGFTPADPLPAIDIDNLQ